MPSWGMLYAWLKDVVCLVERCCMLAWKMLCALWRDNITYLENSKSHMYDPAMWCFNRLYKTTIQYLLVDWSAPAKQHDNPTLCPDQAGSFVVFRCFAIAFKLKKFIVNNSCELLFDYHYSNWLLDYYYLNWLLKLITWLFLLGFTTWIDFVFVVWLYLS